MQSIKTELIGLLHRNDLLRSSLLIGQIQDAAFNMKPYQEQLLEMSARIWNLCGGKHESLLKAEKISQVLFQEYGIEGKSDRYKQVIDDPNRFYIHTVLQKKVASPLALTVLYCILADQVGLQYECLALPSYFLLKLTDNDEEYYLDPFDHGKILTGEDFQKKFKSAMQRNRMMSQSLFEKVSISQLVARLAQQLKHIYILKGSAVEALRAVEFLTGIFPSSPELTRDRGVLYCEMEYFSKAKDDLKFYLDNRPNAEDVAEIKKLAGMLKGYREVVN